MKQPAVYMLASQRNGTLYVGVTSNLIGRIWQHRNDVVECFTRDFAVKTLVWYEMHATMESAISREKALKKWRRTWKLQLIEERNPCWIDLWSEINGEAAFLEPFVPDHLPSWQAVEEKNDGCAIRFTLLYSRVRENDDL